MWVGFLVMALGAAVLTAVGWYAWLGKLPRQHFAGIRTPYTMANDEQWYATHKYGAPYLIFGGVATLAMALAVLPFAIAGALPNAFATAILIAGAFVILIAALSSWFFGVKTAKAHLAR
ncbi:MAG: SdpI family protein [Chloroflexi bacterium]|nr:SdpI family protein [Dehalococcoidia bacterium]MCO5200366.1 SdpI family protein [Chloroflexota bacterium]MCZ7576072.1 SdpI family protein [Dehalococcoidia bacterium]